MSTHQKDFKVSQMEARTLLWWRARRSQIDMSPPYQRRGRLWSTTDKAYLIDSILNGYDIPKVYMADFTWGHSALNGKRLPYAIIDGKQRFEAIFDFFDGLVTLNDDFVLLDDPSLPLAGLSYQDLKDNYPEIAEVFETFNLLVMSVVAHTVEPINELFVRLNRSKSLTGAEIRNAMNGPAPEVIRSIAAHDFFQNNIKFTVTRGQDLNAAAKVLLFEFRGELQETKKRNLDSFVGALDSKDRGPLELAGRRVVDGLEVMSTVFLPKDGLLTSNGVIPVYYWFVTRLHENQRYLVRSFLVEFERARRENRQLGDKAVDDALAEYDHLTRSTNDLRSHRGRYEILRTRFAHFSPRPGGRR